MNWYNILKNIMYETSFITSGFLKYVFTVFGIVSFGAVLYSIIDLAKSIKLNGLNYETKIEIIIVTCFSLFSMACFYLKKVLEKKEEKLKNNNR